MHRPRILSVLFVAAYLSVPWELNAVLVAEDSRTWTSSDKRSTLQASFHSYDPKTKQVVLLDDQGNSIEIGLRQLSKSDQRFVRRAQKKQKQSPVTTEQAGKVTAERKATERKNLNHQGTQKQAFGIQWTLGIEKALKIANGNRENPADDRPVMWLRVLGDLEGYM